MTTAPAPLVSVQQVKKRFGGFTAVDDVSLSVPRNAFFALLGPSGCGKTTLLRMLAGFETPSSGRILIDGEDMAGVPPNRRPVNMVFQSYAVFPHMTVAQNVAYGLRVSGVPRAEIGPRVEEALAMVRLEGFAGRKPGQLSGGQRQRVALARALIKRPKLLLLDEPLSALDKKLREDMQLELVRLQHEVGITFVIVTHDQEEALSMATEVAVMDRGRVLQIAAPRDLYEQPNCRFVADFIGAMNLFAARAANEGADGHATLDVDGVGRLALPHVPAAAGEVVLGVRPEKIKIAFAEPRDADAHIPGRIAQIAYFGDYSHLFVETEGGQRVTVLVNNARRAADADMTAGRPCWLTFAPADAVVLPD
jgi:spermidine/putrescine ABC transporter ATP-binding subunit